MSALAALALLMALGCDKPKTDPAAGNGASTAQNSAATSPSARAPSTKASAAGAPPTPVPAGQLAPETWEEGEVKWAARYTVYPALNVAMGQQHPAEIDTMVVDMAAGSKVIQVDVIAQGVPKDGLRFTTRFSGPGGKTEKRWAPAAANKKGPFRALISAPADTNAARTRLVTP